MLHQYKFEGKTSKTFSSAGRGFAGRNERKTLYESKRV